MEIKNRILRTEPTDWRKFKFLQTDRFKEFPDELRNRLRESIVRNHFLETFKVWQDGKDIFCLDGFHRCLILKELEASGYKVPARLPAEFIDCKNRNEAAKLVLIYSSAYAEVRRSSLAGYISEFDLDLDELMDELNLSFSDREDDFEAEGNEEENCEYPIVPRFSERYDYVLIFCKNEIDYNNLAELLGLQKEKSYKSQTVGTGKVLTYDRFMSVWNNKKRGANDES